MSEALTAEAKYEIELSYNAAAKRMAQFIEYDVKKPNPHDVISFFRWKRSFDLEKMELSPEEMISIYDETEAWYKEHNLIFPNLQWLEARRQEERAKIKF